MEAALEKHGFLAKPMISQTVEDLKALGVQWSGLGASVM